MNSPKRASTSNVLQGQKLSITSQHHIGPIPDPDTLERYNNIQPGFAERIIMMAEKEQDTRLQNNKAAIDNQHAQHKRDTDTFRIGQCLALTAVLMVVGLCVYTFYLGYATQGASIAGIAIVGVITGFTVKKNKNQS